MNEDTSINELEILRLRELRKQTKLLEEMNQNKEVHLNGATLKGEPGHTPTDEELLSLIIPLIPEPVGGEDGHTPTKDELLEIIRPLIPKVKDGRPPTKEELLYIIKPLIPPPIKPKDGIDGKNPSPKEIIEELKNLEGDEARDFGKKVGSKIDISDIRNANSFLFNNKRIKFEELLHGGGSSSGGGGVTSIAAVGNPALTGAVTLSAGSNITLTEVGQNIEIASTGGGGTPAAPDTSVQFNDGGNFGGNANFTFDKTNNSLAIGDAQKGLAALEVTSDSNFSTFVQRLGPTYDSGLAGNNIQTLAGIGAWGDQTQGGLYLLATNSVGLSDNAVPALGIEARIGNPALSGAIAFELIGTKDGDSLADDDQLFVLNNGYASDRINIFGDGSAFFRSYIQTFNIDATTWQVDVDIPSNGSTLNGFYTRVGVQGGSASDYASMRGFLSHVEHSGSGVLTGAVGYYVDKIKNTGAGSITNAYGLYIDDQNQADNNWAIKTGLGQVEFGDDVQVDNLGGSGTQIVTANNDGVLGVGAINVPEVVASTFEKSETGSDANILTYTTGGTDEFLTVQVATDVSAITGTSIVVTVTWKDSNNTTAISILTLTAAGDGTINIPINSKASQTVVVSSVFVGVSTAYKISAFISKLN